jgi:hypothetical protein
MNCFAAFIALSLVPDYRIPNWGHDRYYISHSIFTNALLMLGLVLLLAKRCRLPSRLNS